MSAFVIKIIAVTAMFFDHLNGVLPEYFPFAFRIVGRLVFPLFAYLLAQGCRHTRSMPKFMLRLALFALISQIPFDLALNMGQINFLFRTNVFYTLLLGVISVYCYQYFYENRLKLPLWLSVIPLFILMWLAERLRVDHGGFGVAFIFTMYVIPEKKIRLVIMALFCAFRKLEFFFGILGHWVSGFDVFIPYTSPIDAALLVFYLLSVVIAAMHNGKRGRDVKWLFYIFYPAHLLVLGLIRHFHLLDSLA